MKPTQADLEALPPRVQVALGSQVLGKAGHGDLVSGHVSLRDPEGRGIYMKARGWALEEITPDHILLIDWEGNALEGEGVPHTELPIHLEILKARPDINSVVHTHPIHALAFSISGHPLRPVSHEGTSFVPPDLPRFTETTGLIRTKEQGVSLATQLGDRNAVILANHGIVTVGAKVSSASMMAYILERACKVQLMAMSVGGWASWTSDEEALSKRASRLAPVEGWPYLVRKLPKADWLQGIV